MSAAKSYAIPKRLVWEAYLRVKENGGSAGVDGQTVELFAENLKNNLYRIWNRMSSGTYFPPAIRQVGIPKRDGGKRYLGIPTVADRIAQTVVKMALEPVVERWFHPDSYGYRPKKSAIEAVGRARSRCWQFDWVIDLDIRSFFDSLDHQLVMRALGRYTTQRWILLYVERWLKAPVQTEEGTTLERGEGTPQGGVVSPVLANLFLHLAFDTWMQRQHPETPFERYADDIVVHCRTKEQAETVLTEIQERLRRCRLEIHPQKTKIVYCRDSNRIGNHEVQSFDFLGFTFRPRRARNKWGKYFTSFCPAVSGNAVRGIRQTMRNNWRIRLRTDKSLEDLAKMFNPMLRGWINYYGSFYRSAMNRALRPLEYALMKWAMRKYRRFKGHQRRARKWLEGVAERAPVLFAHWQMIPREQRGS